MPIVLVLLALYSGILYYLFNNGTDSIRKEWDADREWLLKKAGCILGVWALFTVLNFFLLLFNGQFVDQSSLIFYNVFCAAVGFSAALGLLADRRIFSGAIFLLYLLDLFQFNRYAAAVTDDSLEDSGVSLGFSFNLFINFVVFPLAMLADYHISLEEPESEYL